MYKNSSLAEYVFYLVKNNSVILDLIVHKMPKGILEAIDEIELFDAKVEVLEKALDKLTPEENKRVWSAFTPFYQH